MLIWLRSMSESFYMAEIDLLLETMAAISCGSDDPEFIKKEKVWTIDTLVKRYGLDRDNAESEVAAAMGEEP